MISQLVERNALTSTGVTDFPIKLAEFLVDTCSTQLAERALAQEVLANGRSVKAFQLMAKLYQYREDYARAEEQLQEALSMDDKDPVTWLQLGN